ncbi:hypothetical protein HYR99_06015 [Candidatus Poribacteria bacterium]|nr:hypothetical protein [Candidatus Poribacteria bacterium]
MDPIYEFVQAQKEEWFKQCVEEERAGTRVIKPEVNWDRPWPWFAVLIGLGFRPSNVDISEFHRQGHLEGDPNNVFWDSTLPWKDSQEAQSRAFIKAKIACEVKGVGGGLSLNHYDCRGRELSSTSGRNYYLMTCKLKSAALHENPATEGKQVPEPDTSPTSTPLATEARSKETPKTAHESPATKGKQVPEPDTFPTSTPLATETRSKETPKTAKRWWQFWK